MIRLKSRDYEIILDVRFTVIDLTAVAEDQKSEAIRQELMRLQRKRLAGIEAARKKEAQKFK